MRAMRAATHPDLLTAPCGPQGLYLVQLSQAYDRLSPAGAAGSMGLFSGAGGAGTPIGGLLALVGSSLLMQGGTTNATIMLLLFAILALGNLLLLALPAVPHTPTPRRSDAVQEPPTHDVRGGDGSRLHG